MKKIGKKKRKWDKRKNMKERKEEENNKKIRIIKLEQ